MTDAPPTVSVVVATRDRPVELREALAAISDQDYAGTVETLVVFDRSEPDLTLASTDPRRPVRVMTNERSPGLAGARNTGIVASVGELVAFCDDDDAWLPGKLVLQVAALQADPQLEVVTTGIRIDYAGTSTDRILPGTSVTFAELLRSRLTELHPSSFCFRRSSLLDGIGLVEEALPGSYAEDYELLLRAARRHPIHAVPEALVAVRWHQQSFFEGKWEIIVNALEWLLAHYPEFATEPAGLARITGQIAFAEAARGNRRSALRWAARTVRRNPTEGRAPLAAVVALGLASPERVLAGLHARGRGL
jgi:glycosyltransferase involved in cell wall biosynthesis